MVEKKGGQGTGGAGPQIWPLQEQAGYTPCQTQKIPAISSELYNSPPQQTCQPGSTSVKVFKKEKKST